MADASVSVPRGESRNKIYIIGAGFSGVTIAAEIRAKRIFGRVVAFLDDDSAKIGSRIHGVPVLGPIEAAAQLIVATPADEAIIAIPSATREQLARIYAILRRAGFARIRIVPRISQILDGEAHLIQAREIDPEDFLARSPVRVNLRKSLSYVRGRRVLVTGAGGSIGSELCRQLLEGGAERLYLFGHGENSIFEIQRELRLLQEEGVGEKATLVPIIGEIQDRDYLNFILARTRADVVFHTAAHKHVALMEANPVEAVKNNVFGTLNIVSAARRSGVQRFVLISTDKAVEPTSVYGASKLLAEEIVLREARNGHHFLVVRFGNVLGSRGSILPLFRRQILKGGPVTVTDPAARRFFMTIPEASSLVLTAGGTGCGGEVYLLDMGEDVSIKDLAEQMIRFYGFEPGTDIPIVYTGLREGEKLLEKLHADTEVPEPTPQARIMKLRRKTLINGRINSVLDRLRPICFHDPGHPQLFRNRRALRAVLEEVIPGIGPSVNEPEF
ncbi:MAG TPA: nucleoside-diphosphate sugar epimerase/dehydratase [Spirochaetia bacterium]|nr:nucleoside-diphosphate sugar epimerase/dehydratase [Spirochaetia bacterium]